MRRASASLPGAQDHQHALLALAQHDLVGGHLGLACRHPVEIELDAEPALAGHFDRRRCQAGGPHVLDRDDRVTLHQLEAGLDQQFLGERIADLHRRPLFPGIAAQNSAEAIVAPWMPSRPVLAPT